MGRPQEVDVAELLGHARAIWMAEGIRGVTIRALSERSGVSNGSIYYHFSSRNHILSQVWADEAAKFRAYQQQQIDAARSRGTAEDAVVAGALATGSYAHVEGAAVRVLLASRPDAATPEGVPEPVLQELRRHVTIADTMIADLAADVWGRTDAPARRLMRICLVDIPARIFMTAERPDDPVALHAIEHAVRGLLAAGPPDQ